MLHLEGNLISYETKTVTSCSLLFKNLIFMKFSFKLNYSNCWNMVPSTRRLDRYFFDIRCIYWHLSIYKDIKEFKLFVNGKKKKIKELWIRKLMVWRSKLKSKFLCKLIYLNCMSCFLIFFYYYLFIIITTCSHKQGSWNIVKYNGMVTIGDQYILTGEYHFNFLDSICFLNP